MNAYVSVRSLKSWIQFIDLQILMLVKRMVEGLQTWACKCGGLAWLSLASGHFAMWRMFLQGSSEYMLYEDCVRFLSKVEKNNKLLPLQDLKYLSRWA